MICPILIVHISRLSHDEHPRRAQAQHSLARLEAMGNHDKVDVADVYQTHDPPNLNSTDRYVGLFFRD